MVFKTFILFLYYLSHTPILHFWSPLGKIDNLYRRVVHKLAAKCELSGRLLKKMGCKSKGRLDCAGSCYLTNKLWFEREKEGK